ncbi:MAG: tyrosine-type recombinase/integrase [Solitalea sp.]
MHTDRFYSYLQFEKRFSPHTLLAYRNDLEAFAAFLQRRYGIPDLKSTERDMVRSWVVDLMEAGRSPSTIARKLSVLRTYFKFLLKEAVIMANPVQHVRAPKAGRRLPVFVEESRMERLRTVFDGGMSFSSCRDRLLVETLYQTGIRLAELIGLREEDLDFDRQKLRVIGKRRKERVIPFTREFGNSLQEYIRLKKLTPFDNKPEVLFVKDNGERLNPRFVYTVVKNYLDMVDTPGKKSPHVLRHTFATHLLNKGADLYAVKELLGHASLAATQIYTHNSIARMKEAWKQAHPKG